MRRAAALVAALAVGTGLAACGPADAPVPSPGGSPVAAPTASPDPVELADGRRPAAGAGPVVAPEAAWADHDAVAADAYALGYTGSVAPISAELAARMAPSWRAGCPVPLADLRYVTVTYRDFDGAVATGELVVHADVADGVVAVFGELFALGYPIRSMRLVDDFGGSDDASMAADNTSAFNCRPISRGTGWSEHAYGRAIDLNPVENPYVRGSLVLPPEGEPYAARPDAPGVVHAGDAVVRAFAAHGWEWGGSWTSPVDYQHFSTTGR